MKKCLSVIVGVAIFSLCGQSRAQAPAKEQALVKHVVLIGVDGLGADYLPWNAMPNTSKLREGGKYAIGRNCFPTASAINWATALMGTTVDMHGYRQWNSQKPDVPAYMLTAKGKPPCIFSEIRRQNPKAYTVSMFNWDGIGFIHETSDVSEAMLFVNKQYPNISQAEAAETTTFIAKLAKQPVLGFLYFDSVDGAGHGHGWGSPEYTNACILVDKQIGRVMDALEKSGAMKDTAILLVADHGGKDKGHGSADIVCAEIPFLVYGPGIQQLKFREPVMLADTAPTIAWLLGYEVFEGWRGRPALKR